MKGHFFAKNLHGKNCVATFATIHSNACDKRVVYQRLASPVCKILPIYYLSNIILQKYYFRLATSRLRTEILFCLSKSALWLVVLVILCFSRFVVELKALEAGSFGWCKLQTTYVI